MGLFDKDRLYGGKRMQQEFAQDELFILWDMACVYEGMELPDSAAVADKTELVVQRTDGTEAFIVTTLSGPIAKMAKANVRTGEAPGQVEDEDLPAVVCWRTVPNKVESYSDAVVLSFQGNAEVTEPVMPARFSFSPVTTAEVPY